MFELAVIRRHASGEQIVDAGVIAETLLFYGNVHVVADSGILAQLLKVVGSDNLLQLIRHKLMTMSFVRSMLAVHTENANNIPLHRFISAWVAADARGKKYNDERWVHHVFETALGKSHATRKAANKLLEHISVRTDIVVPGEPRGIPGLADADLADGAYVHSAIERAIISLVPAYSLPPRWEFRIVPGDNGFYILTDLPFNALNAEYHKTVPVSHSTLTPEFLISSVLDARADIQIASDHMAELITTEATSQIIQLKFESILRKRQRNIQQIELFQSTLLQNARAIGAAINSGERKFDEFLPVLEKASRFKDWLRKANPDETLMGEYIKAATSDTWVDKLPTKGVRFVAATGLGAVAEALFPTGGLSVLGSLGVGAVDSLLVDRVLKGWRPSQFVEGPLKNFAIT